MTLLLALDFTKSDSQVLLLAVHLGKFRGALNLGV